MITHKRNSSIELYRCLLMLGIVRIHVFGCKDNWRWLSYALLVCVDGFIFISGYFGIRFSWFKLLKLYGVGMFSSLVVAFAFGARGGQLFWAAHQQLWGLWFFTSYLFLMMVAPLLNELIDGIKNKYDSRGGLRLCFPFFILAFGLSYFYSYNSFRVFMPEFPTFGQFSPLTMIGVYVVARLMRVYSIEDHLPTKWLVVTGCVLIVVGAFRVSLYNSPTCVLLAAATFFLARRVKIPENGWIAKIANFIAPSTFGIYLLHTSEHVFDLYRSSTLWQSIPWIWGGVVLIFITYLGALVVDLVRRAGVRLSRYAILKLKG